MSNSRGIEINEQDVLASGAFFSCYTEVLRSEVFISTVVGVVMTGVKMTGVDGLQLGCE